MLLYTSWIWNQKSSISFPTILFFFSTQTVEFRSTVMNGPQKWTFGPNSLMTQTPFCGKKYTFYRLIGGVLCTPPPSWIPMFFVSTNLSCSLINPWTWHWNNIEIQNETLTDTITRTPVIRFSWDWRNSILFVLFNYQDLQWMLTLETINRCLLSICYLVIKSS